MPDGERTPTEALRGEALYASGQVQGVGFRPTVWRLARELGLAGDVRNTVDGVEIRVWGAGGALDRFAERLAREAPRQARIDRLTRAALDAPAPDGFVIRASGAAAGARVTVTPDLATCPACVAEVFDPAAHRHGYPFTNCTDCGPRFSIVRAAPYDRANTAMAGFEMCAVCRGEYEDPADRRFHAQPIACPACGPRAWLEALGDVPVPAGDAIDAAAAALLAGHVVAIKGLGGFHLACDATNAEAVDTLRARKRRRAKAFALMARDVHTIRRFCAVSPEEVVLLESPESPIVLLRADGPERLPADVAPGLDRQGLMLPNTPLHHLLFQHLDRPLVMTSGNPSGQPQATENDDARARLAGIADFALCHDRDILNRIDDSVVRWDNHVLVLRRARGYAPAPLPVPPGLPDRKVLALGGELKNTFCLVTNGNAVLSQHMGDLEDAATATDVAHNLALYRELYRFAPEIIAVDLHPEYLSTKRGKDIAGDDLPVVEVQHHHAHVAACLAENGWDGGRVLGIALDGLGYGSDGTVWGGEFLHAGYDGYERLGCLKPVPLIGGTAAIREPWRNAYAQLMAAMSWDELVGGYGDLPIVRALAAKPRATLVAMVATGTNTPLTSSCGRLFDAAAAIAGVRLEAQDYEGQAAMLFEATLDDSDDVYAFAIGGDMPQIDPALVWRAMLDDVAAGVPVGALSARFHRGLADSICAMVRRLGGPARFPAVALTGGCFQNYTLARLVRTGLAADGRRVLVHSRVPANDGGLALGQAMVALATRN